MSKASRRRHRDRARQKRKQRERIAERVFLELCYPMQYVPKYQHIDVTLVKEDILIDGRPSGIGLRREATVDEVRQMYR